MIPFVQRLQSTYSKINNLENNVLYTSVLLTLSTWLVEKFWAHLWPSSSPQNIPKTFFYLQIAPLIWTRYMTSHYSTNMPSLSLLYDCNFSHIFSDIYCSNIIKSYIVLSLCCIYNPWTLVMFLVWFGLVFRVFWLITIRVYLLAWALDVLPGQKYFKQ